MLKGYQPHIVSLIGIGSILRSVIYRVHIEESRGIVLALIIISCFSHFLASATKVKHSKTLASEEWNVGCIWIQIPFAPTIIVV